MQLGVARILGRNRICTPGLQGFILSSIFEAVQSWRMAKQKEEEKKEKEKQLEQAEENAQEALEPTGSCQDSTPGPECWHWLT